MEQVHQVHVQILVKVEQNIVQVEQVHVVQYQVDTTQLDAMDLEINVRDKQNVQQVTIVQTESHMAVEQENGVMQEQHHVLT